MGGDARHSTLSDADRVHRGDPLARLIAGHGRGHRPLPAMDQMRAGGRWCGLRSLGSAWTTACAERFCATNISACPTAPSAKDVPRPLRTLITRTEDEGVANPVEPPAMVVVDPPEHTRYRQLVSQSFTPRAIDKLATRVDEVTHDLIERLADTPIRT